MPGARSASILFAALLIGGCASNLNLATQRQEYTFTSTGREVEQGRKLALRVRRELNIVEDESVAGRVRAIGERLAAVSDRRELVYSFAVVDDDDVNAFSLPGGYVFMNTGLIKRASSDDEIAAVMAHEIAHITARHAVKRLESGLGMQLAQLATLASRQSALIRGGSLGMQAAQLAYARQDELEADQLGVKYMKAAGFDPKAMLSFLEKLQQEHEKENHYMPRGIIRPQYALTHPYVPERTRAVKEALYGVADYIDYLNSQ